jgi:hypothetical protein
VAVLDGKRKNEQAKACKLIEDLKSQIERSQLVNSELQQMVGAGDEAKQIL